MMKAQLKNLVIIAVSIILTIWSCKKDEDEMVAKPKVTTGTVTSEAEASFNYQGNVTDKGGAEVTDRGVCYSTNIDPTIHDDKKSNGKGEGSFTGSVSGLKGGEIYYVRAYATNSAGTGYGKIVKVGLKEVKKLVGAEQAYPDKDGEVVTLDFRGTKIKCSKINNEYFYQGDILIDVEGYKKRAAANDKGGVATSYTGSRWPKNTVYYTVDPNFPKKERIDGAIALFKDTNIKFIERTNEANYVYFIYKPGRGTYSMVGMVGGKQEIVVANWAEAGSIAHEILHALGLFHMQSKYDRDKYVKINYNNIKDGQKHNFNKYPKESSVVIEGFDFNSIMLYHSWGFSKKPYPELPTMTKLDGSTFNPQRKKLMPGDVEMVNKIYPTLSNFKIEKNGVVITEDKTTEISIISGNGDYTITGSNKDKATATVVGDKIIISAIAEGTAEITIMDNRTQESENILVTVLPKIGIDKETITLEAGEKAIVNVTSGSGTYTVSSNNKTKATVSISGKVITINAISKGTATITVKDTKTKQTKTVAVTVEAKTPDLAIDKAAITIEATKSTTVNITAGSGDYTVSSSDESKAKASVSSVDEAITINAIAEGTATITVKDTKTKQTKTVTVTIKAKTPNLAIDKTVITLEAGKKSIVNVTSGSGTYTVSSNNKTKATVSISGKVITINAIAKGTATITVKDTKTKQTKTVTVTVKAKTPDLAINKATVTIEATQSTIVNIIAGSGTYTVSSSDESKAKASVSSVDEAITINAIAEGTATITVKDTKTNQTKTIAVIVVPSIPDLSIDEADVTLDISEIKTVDITSGSGEYTIVSDNESIALASREANGIVIVGLDKGVTTVRITDTKSGQTKTITVTVNGVDVQTINAPAGTFTMGAVSQDGSNNDEYPLHPVTLSAFKMAKYEITNAQFAKFLTAKGNQEEGGQKWYNGTEIVKDQNLYKVEAGKEKHPVRFVTWYGAKAFAEWVGGRLPTEAEWEYVARGGQAQLGTNPYRYSGSDDIDDVAWCESNSLNTVHNVGEKNPNQWGTYDMSGNAAEWCSDWYGVYTESMDPAGTVIASVDPQGSSSGTERVVRGGNSYTSGDSSCRVSARSKRAPNNYSKEVGFRVVILDITVTP